MLKSLKFLLLAITASAIMACSSFTQPISKPEASVPAGLSTKTVSATIVKSLQDRDWIVKSNKNGVINAVLIVRGHKAIIDIPYNNRSFAILYKDSENLKANGNNIHNKYNHWVNNLLVDIKNNLDKEASK